MHQLPSLTIRIFVAFRILLVFTLLRILIHLILLALLQLANPIALTPRLSMLTLPRQFKLTLLLIFILSPTRRSMLSLPLIFILSPPRCSILAPFHRSILTQLRFFVLAPPNLSIFTLHRLSILILTQLTYLKFQVRSFHLFIFNLQLFKIKLRPTHFLIF